ncbi:MAG TPA: hypothetical protein VJX23_05435 [Candidatus Binataceae bacterium]|nr:hypothetical protein [Candidatus Binataceae bacterium]
MTKEIVGIADEQRRVSSALNQLKVAGFTRQQISGSVAIPGIGVVISAGPLMTALTEGDGPIGGIAEVLVGAGFTEDQARHYQDEIEDGGVLLMVDADDGDESRTATEVFEAVHLSDIADTHPQIFDVPASCYLGPTAAHGRLRQMAHYALRIGSVSIAAIAHRAENIGLRHYPH